MPLRLRWATSFDSFLSLTIAKLSQMSNVAFAMCISSNLLTILRRRMINGSSSIHGMWTRSVVSEALGKKAFVYSPVSSKQSRAPWSHSCKNQHLVMALCVRSAPAVLWIFALNSCPCWISFCVMSFAEPASELESSELSKNLSFQELQRHVNQAAGTLSGNSWFN